MSKDCQCWAFLPFWTTSFKRCSIEVFELIQTRGWRAPTCLLLKKICTFCQSNVEPWLWKCCSLQSSAISIHHDIHISHRNHIQVVRFRKRTERLGFHQRALNQIWQKLTIWHRNWIERTVPSFQIVSKPRMVLMLILISSTTSLLILISSPWLLVWCSRNCWFSIRIAWCWKWWMLKRWGIIRSCWFTMRVANICHDYIGFIFLLLLGIAEGFCLASLAARDTLDSSTFEGTLDAFSNRQYMGEVW